MNVQSGSKDPDLAEKCVFLMDCEQRCSEGIIYSLATKGFLVIALSPERLFPARFSSYVHDWVQSPKLENGFEAYFKFLCYLKRKGVIVPSGDLSVKFLSSFKDRLHEKGFLVNVPDPETLHRLFDKWECNQLCEELGVPVARSALARDAAEAHNAASSMDWPLIVKPTSLAGGNYAKVQSQDELKTAFNALSGTVNRDTFKLHESEVLIQEWIDLRMSDNWSCDLFFDRKGDLVDSVTIQRIRTSLSESGLPTSRLYCGEIRENEVLTKRTHDLLRQQNWKGFAHVEYIFCRKRNDYVLTEVNPRLPGYSYLLSASGHEQAYFYSADLFEVPFDVKTTKNIDAQYYFEALRYPGDISDGIVNSWRGYLRFNEIMRSYLKAARSPKRTVVDYFNSRDLRLTVMIQAFNMVRFGAKVVSYLRRRIRSYVKR